MDRLRADMARRDADMAERDSSRDAGISSLKSAMDRLRADMAKRDAARDVDMMKRDKDNTRWLIGMWVAAVIVLGTFLGTLITVLNLIT